ncbi:MAG: DNA polymerase IV [Chloroflexi bacterium]|nr:DNA polymerase IV [Chloroflexota bacterium]
MAMRWIIHVDLDAFFASVEELLDPTLKGKPVIVGGDPSGRGVVASCSYAARAYGVHSAMPMGQAIRLCPQGIIVHGHYRMYGHYSEQVMDILKQVTPLVEQVSIDEAFLDVTGCEKLWGPIEHIAHMIQERVNSEVNLPVSLGVAACKIVAKIACDYGKPHGLVIVPPGEEASFLAPLAIERLWGVGKVTGAHLRSLGITTIGKLADYPTLALERLLGSQAEPLQQLARGIDVSQVTTERERRSVSKEVTFSEDVRDYGRLARTLLSMSEQVASSMRAHALVGRTVRIKLRYPDFSTITRQAILENPTDQEQVVYQEALRLLKAQWKAGDAVRLLGVGMSNLLEQGGYQLNLFEHSDIRRSRLNDTLDAIRARWGDDAIQRASLLDYNARKGK